MSIYTRVLHIMMGILFIAGLASCGGDTSKSGKAKMSILPEKPVVITADVEQDGKKYSGPWFNFRGSMFNGSTDTITVVALEIEVTGMGSSGNPTTSKVAFSPGQFNQDVVYLPMGATTPITVACKYTHFAQLNAGDDSQFELLGAPETVCAGYGPVFIIGGNPKGPPGNTNFRYTLKIKPVGWFGTYDTPTDRFMRQQTFYTQ